MRRCNFTKKCLLVVATSIVACNFVCADISKTCVTDVNLKSEGNNIKVNIYTNKPYTDSVVVSKKEGNKYVILIPETTSAVKSTPKVIGGGNVSVNMQTINAGKGYTKITITSDKSVNILPKTMTTSASSSVKKNIAVSAKPKAQQIQPAQKSVNKQSNQIAKNPSTQVKKSTSQPTPKKSAQTIKKTTSTTVTKKSVPQTNKTIATNSVKKTASTSVNNQSKPQIVYPSSVNKHQEIKPIQAQNSANRNKPLTILQKEVETGKVSDIKATNNDTLLDETIKANDKIIKQRNLKKKKKNKQTVSQVVDTNISVKDGIKLVLDELQELSIWKLLLLAGAVGFPIIVIMIILNLDKKINKRINSMKKEDDIAIVERALKEKVNEVRAQQNYQENVTVQQTNSQYNSFDEMLDKVEDTPDVPLNYEDNLSEKIIDDNTTINTSDFDIDDNIKDNSVSDITETKLNNYENLMDDDSVIEQKAVVPYNPDGVLADFSNISDKDFFNELILQSCAETDVNMLPDNLPADEIFNEMTESDTGIQLSDFEKSNFESDLEDEAQTKNSSLIDNPITMLNEVKINDNTGLYLVNYDNSSSLVGHVADDYFVLKQFDGIVNGNIIIKPADHTENSQRYLVRVGRNKMVVEVNDKSMSRLIDL